MKRTVLGFSLRIDATSPLEAMRGRLEDALGCSFAAGDFNEVPALVTEILGMRVVFFGWRGLNRARTFRLQGYVDDRRYLNGLSEEELEDLEGVRIDISEAVIDLLNVRGAGEWHIPSRAEIEAELDYGQELADRLHR